MSQKWGQVQTNDGRQKRWVVVRPSGAQTGILLARADGEHQVTVIGQQFAGRVGLFLRVEDFDASYQRMVDGGVRFVSEPRVEAYGKVAVFLDLAGCGKTQFLSEICNSYFAECEISCL